MGKKKREKKLCLCLINFEFDGPLEEVHICQEKKKKSFDGGSEVMSRVRRGVLSLRVVRQMLS